jgi:hypothetical protein
MPVVSSELDIHQTFMDTFGRTSLRLTALNVVDDFRDRDVTVRATKLSRLACELTRNLGHIRLPLDGRFQKARRHLHVCAERLWRCMVGEQARRQHCRQKSVDFRM